MSNRKILAIIIAILLTVFTGSCTAAETNPAGNSVPHFNATDSGAPTETDSNSLPLSTDQSNYSNPSILTYSSADGTYYFCETSIATEYLNFLAGFNDEKYEIVNITIQTPTYMSNHYHYMITYKNKDA